MEETKMTLKKLVILAVVILAILFGLQIFAYARINGHEAQLAEQAQAIAALQKSQDAAQEEKDEKEPETTPEPVVYIVSPVTAFNAYTVEAAPYFTLPAAESEPDGMLEAGSNAVVSGVCGDFYYAALPDGTTCYIPQQYLAQIPDPTPELTPEPTPEPTPEVTPVPEATPEVGTEAAAE